MVWWAGETKWLNGPISKSFNSNIVLAPHQFPEIITLICSEYILSDYF